MTKILSLQSHIKKNSISSVSGSSRLEANVSEHEDSSILDTLEIEDLMSAPNLLNVMTIRSIPLQKRDSRLKLVVPEAISSESFNMNLPLSIKRAQNLKELTRPDTGKPLEVQLNLRIGSAMGQRSTISKRY